MADYKRKRYSSGPSHGGMKRARMTKSGPLMRGGNYYSKTLPKMYVQRTPGGQVVAENHYYDSDRSSSAITTSTSTWSGANLDPNSGGINQALFCPTIGDDITNRTARKAFLKKIRICGNFSIPAQTAQTGQDAACIIRLVVFEDAQTNAAQAAGDLVLNQGLAANAISMGMSTVNFGRFRILKDKSYVIQAPDYSGLTGAMVAAGRSYPFKFSIKVNKNINFNATNGGTVADIVDYSHHFMCLCDSNSMAPVIVYKARCTFLP